MCLAKKTHSHSFKPQRVGVRPSSLSEPVGCARAGLLFVSSKIKSSLPLSMIEFVIFAVQSRQDGVGILLKDEFIILILF